MRVFPPEFETSRRNGSAPVWLLRFTAGGTDYVLCQDAVTIAPWGLTARPWIASWGNMSQGVTGALDDFRISDLTVNLINDPDASPTLRSRVKSKQLHGISVSVYFWYDGCAAAPVEMARYRVRDIDLPDEVFVSLEVQDDSIRYENFYPGNTLTQSQYPYADPDDIGKIIPMPFGTVKKLMALAVNAGAMTSLPHAISATAASFAVSDGSHFLPGMIIRVDDEQMSITDISGDALTVTRGVNVTVAVTHQRGAVVWESKEEFVYMVADYPVTSMNKVYGRVGQSVMDISSVCTQWPAGNHPGYPGKAVVSVPGFITVEQAVDLFLHDSISVTNGTLAANLGGNIARFGSTSLAGTVVKNNTVTLSGTIAGLGSTTLAGNIADYAVSDPSHTHTGSGSMSQAATNCPVGPPNGLYTPSGVYAIVTFPALAGTRIAVTYTVVIHNIIIPDINGKVVTIKVGSTIYINDSAELNATKQGMSVTYQFSINAGDFAANSLEVNVSHLNYTNGGPNWTVSAASRSVTYNNQVVSSATGITKQAANNGTLVIGSEKTYNNGSLGVNDNITVSNGTLGINDNITVDKATLEAYLTGTLEKSGTATFSGNSVANTLIGDAILVDVVSPYTTPAAVIGKVLNTPCTQIGTFPAGYSFNGAINTSRRALEWCHDLARQCRAYFVWRLGQPTLIVRPDVLTPVKTISEVRLSNGRMIHGQRLTDINDVINTINLQYDRDWSGGGAESYRQVAAGTNAASIAAYGVRERPELFRSDFVTNPAMAASLVSFYLSWYAWQRWRHTQECYLFDAALEFSDAVTLGFLGGEIGEVAEVGFSPGNGRNIDKIQLTVIE